MCLRIISRAQIPADISAIAFHILYCEFCGLLKSGYADLWCRVDVRGVCTLLETGIQKAGAHGLRVSRD